MTAEEHPADADNVVERPVTDDYDLLTFGEVAARLSEELVQASGELGRARSEANPDPERIRVMEDRIALLKASADRYRRQQQTNDSFARRFGTSSGTLPDERPRWD